VTSAFGWPRFLIERSILRAKQTLSQSDKNLSSGDQRGNVATGGCESLQPDSEIVSAIYPVDPQ